MRKILLKYNILFILFTISIKTANCQTSSPNYQFTNYSIDDGLSHNFIISIHQDKDGFMWFGSLNGINRFDGQNFMHFERDLNDSNAIIGDFVRFIIEDINGKC